MTDSKPVEVVKSMRTIPNRSVQAQQLEERLRKLAPKETVTYDDLNRLIRGDVQGRERGYLDTARRRLLNEGIAIEAVLRVGMKREDDGGKVECVKNSRQRVRRAARKGLKYAVAVERSALSAQEAQALDLNSAALAVTLNMTSTDGMTRLTSRPQQGAIPDGLTVPRV